ncbi:hypothetical protein HML84_00875 [Alcanivorax sp. IO_7]|nr:hypothetical protein HML84_00875 [Alcanivorax sp. IO_7]
MRSVFSIAPTALCVSFADLAAVVSVVVHLPAPRRSRQCLSANGDDANALVDGRGFSTVTMTEERWQLCRRWLYIFVGIYLAASLLSWEVARRVLSRHH